MLTMNVHGGARGECAIVAGLTLLELLKEFANLLPKISAFELNRMSAGSSKLTRMFNKYFIKAHRKVNKNPKERMKKNTQQKQRQQQNAPFQTRSSTLSNLYIYISFGNAIVTSHILLLFYCCFSPHFYFHFVASV